MTNDATALKFWQNISNSLLHQIRMKIRNSNSNFEFSLRIWCNNEFPAFCQNLSAAASLVIFLEQKTCLGEHFGGILAYAISEISSFWRLRGTLGLDISMTRGRIDLLFFKPQVNHQGYPASPFLGSLGPQRKSYGPYAKNPEKKRIKPVST